MAKLSARGRTELHRIKKVVSRVDAEDAVERIITTTYAFMSDRHLLKKVDVVVKDEDNPDMRLAGGWKDRGKIKSTLTIDEAAKKFIDGGYVKVK